MPNEVRIRVTAHDDTDRVFKSVERKFQDFASRMQKNVKTKVGVDVDRSSLGAAESQLDRRLGRMRKTATAKVVVKPEINEVSKKAFEARLRDFGPIKLPVKPEIAGASMKTVEAKAKALVGDGIKLPVKPEIDRTFWPRVRAFGMRSRGAFGNAGLHSGAAFTAGFIKTITFGQVGSGFARSAIKLAPKMAKVGAGLGVALATGIVLTLSNVLTAALPLAIGAAMLTLPIIGLIKPMIDAQKEIEKITGKITTKQVSLIEAQERVREATNKKQRKAAEERVRDIKEEIGLLEKNRTEFEKLAEPLVTLTDKFKHFVAEVSKPIKPYLLGAMEVIGFQLDHWAPAVKNAFKELGPVLIPFTKGLLDGIAAFFSAIAEDMPSIKAGMGAWAEAFPKIGEALGGLIADIIKDPEGTIQAVTDFVGTLQDLAETSANIIGTVQDVAEAYGELATKVDELENNSNGEAGFVGIGEGTAKGLDDLNKKIDDKIKKIRDKFGEWLLSGGPSDALKEAFSGNAMQDAINAVGGWGDKVGAALERGQDAVTNWFKDLPNKISDAFAEGFKGDSLHRAIKDFIDKAVGWLKALPGRAAHAVGGFGDKIAGKIKDGQDKVTAKAKELVNKVVDWIAKLPGKAKSALNSLASKAGGEVEQAKDRVVGKAKDMVNKAIDFISKLPGKAKAAISSLSSKIGSEVEQAKDNVVRKARAMVTQFIDRMQEMVRKVKDQAGRVKGAITDKFNGAKNWLYSEGKAVINGLLDGMKAPFGALKKWVSGIAGWIKAHKGPISLDRQLLHPAGKALMQGLLSGLKFGFKDVGDFVYKAGSKVSDIISKIKDSMFGAGGLGGKIIFGHLPSGGYRALGRAMAAAYGWTGANWNALNALWTRESGWNPSARNPSSGAAGIPQDITGNFHGGAMGQIAWGLRYIKGRYGSPLAAWAHSQRTGWYDRGGLLPSGGVGVNLSGLPERVLSPAQTKSFDRLVSVMERRPAGAGNTYITIHAPNGFIGSQDQFRRMLVDMNRRAQLEVIKR